MISGFQIIILIFALFALSRAFLRAKDKEISKGEASFWLIVWALVIILVFLPWPAVTVSNYLGIGRPVDLLVYVSIILLFYLLFRIYVKLEKLDHNITDVVRKAAIEKTATVEKTKRTERKRK